MRTRLMSFIRSLVVIGLVVALSFSLPGATRIPVALAASTWQSVGPMGFSVSAASNPSLVVYNGTPYVAYVDGNGLKATVMKFNGTSWVPVGSPGFSADMINYPSLAIYNGTPYVAYKDVGNGYKATVMQFNGTNWVPVGTPGFSAGIVSFTSLAIYNGTPYVAYEDYANSNKATVMQFNGTNWVTVGTAGFSADEADYLSLAIYNGTPYIAYQDYGNGLKATVMQFNGTNWVPVGSPGLSVGEADYPSLVIDNGTPYIAYSDYGNGAKATVMQFNGTNWVPVGSVGFSAAAAVYTSLAVYNGTPYVAYYDYGKGGKATVMQFDGTNWVTVGTAGFSAGEAGYPSLAIYNDTLYVAYKDYGFGGKATVMQYDPSFSVVTDAATSVTSRGATLNGTVNANNSSTTVTFEYGLDTSYGSTVTAAQSPLTSCSDTAVSAAITGLTPNTLYHYRAVGVSAQGTLHGNDQTFTTSAAVPPTVMTNAATSVTVSDATLNGMVNANDYDTTVTFQYGLTTGYGSTITATQSPVTGSSDTAVSATITGLTPNTLYHYRVVGVSAQGTTNGNDQTFTTSAAVPTVMTNAAIPVTTNSETVNGMVNANGYDTTVTFQYGLTTGYGSTITATQSPVTGSSDTAVSATITGLIPNTLYHYRVVGVSAQGTTNGNDQTFTTCSAALVVAMNANDSGPGSLRQAIADICPSGTINFDGDYTITLASTLTIDKDLTIDGAGHAVVLSGNYAVRVIYVSPGVKFNLQNLTVANGSCSPNDYCDGGGLWNNRGLVTVANSTFAGNAATWAGGGLKNSLGTVVITNSLFSGNRATGLWGGPGWGGGINNQGTLTITNSTLISNTTSDAGEGAGLANWLDAILYVSNTNFTDNQSGQGGGLTVLDRGRVTVADSTFSGNSAVDWGGGIKSWGVLTVTNSTFLRNTAGVGGAGIINSNMSVVLSSTFAFNQVTTTAWGGAGIINEGTINVLNSTFISNTSAAGGGGFYTKDGTANIVNSTFAGNSASHGGGLVHYMGNTNVINSTFSGNTGSYCAGGICGWFSGSAFQNSLFANNTNGNCGGYFDAANNLADDTSCGAGFTTSSTILLGALGTYGGGTQIFPLLPGSAAIDATSTNCPATDQRGVVRGATCDLGAYESQGFILTKTSGDNQAVSITSPFTNPLALAVSSAHSEPVNGGQVILTAPTSGASIMAATPLTLTIASGAVSQTVTANGTVGPYSVTASARGATSVAFALRNMATTISTTLTKSVVPVAPLYHGTVTYTVDLTNNGMVTDTNVLFTDVLPTSVTFGAWLEQPAGAVAAGNAITWTGALIPGGTLTFRFTATHTGVPREWVTNTATFTGSVQTGSAAAGFQVTAYVITPTASAGGSIIPSTPQVVDAGNDRVFTITPNYGYHLLDVAIDGTSIGAVNVYTFTNVTADHTISATFDLNDYALTTNTIGQGQITRTPDQATYLFGSVVTLTAVPQPGWYFGQWIGDASGVLTQTTVLMDANKVVTATFFNTPQTYYTLTLSLVGSGLITPTVGAHPYLSGTVVPLSASPAAGWQFSGWSGNADCADGSVTLNANKSCTATFFNTPQTYYTLTLSLVGSGVITPTVGAHPYLSGTVVPLSATPDVGWKFSGWSGDVDCADGSVLMTANKSCTATFASYQVYLPLVLR
jgi:hypothetical protein